MERLEDHDRVAEVFDCCGVLAVCVLRPVDGGALGGGDALEGSGVGVNFLAKSAVLAAEELELVLFFEVVAEC